MHNAFLYIHGKGGSADEAAHNQTVLLQYRKINSIWEMLSCKSNETQK